jgi:hypothetical protein
MDPRPLLIAFGAASNEVPTCRTGALQNAQAVIHSAGLAESFFQIPRSGGET